jgi:tetratricopeptide (TPR) repeat protein
MSRLCRWVAGLSVVAGLGAGLWAGADDVDPASRLDGAMAAAESRLQQDADGAARLYRAALFEGWLLKSALDRVDQHLEDARDAVAKAEALAPGEPPALLSLATAQLQVGQAAAAATLLARLAADDPRAVEPRRLLAKAQAAGGDLDAALRTLDEAGALAADDPEQSFLLATEYLWLKRPEPAARLFARIAQARPIPQTHVLIGRAYRDAGEAGRATASLRAALALDPNVRRAHYYLGVVLLADATLGRARFERAAEEFRAELKLAPDDALANDQLGSALFEAERPADALPAFEAAARAEPRYLYLLHLGRCLLALERAKDGVEVLERALAQAGEQNAPSSDLETIHYQLGLGLRKQGAAPQAAAHFTEARRLSSASGGGEPADGALPPDASGLADLTRGQRDALRTRVRSALTRASFNLGLLALQAPAGKDLAQAASFLETAAALDPEFPRVQSALGVAYFNAGRFTQATGALGRAAAQQPEDAGLRRMLALSWLNTEAWDRAAPLLRDDPERERSASLQLAYGVALARSGRPADAVGPLEAAARLAPEQADVQLELSRAYEQLGRTDQARRSFEAFQRLKANQPGSAQ